MKQIIFVMPSLRGGGTERVVSVLANRLCQGNYKIMIALTKEDQCEYELDPRVICKANPYGGQISGQLRFLRSLMKVCPEATFVSLATYQNMYTLLTGMGKKRRIIISERSAPAQTLYGRKYLEGLRFFLYGRAQAAVFQTEEAMRYFPKWIQNKGVLIENPLSEHLPAAYHGEREKRFVAFSRLTKEKNIAMMLEAFKIFYMAHRDYRLSIYGKGPEKEKLEAYAEEIGLKGIAEFCGFSENIHLEILHAEAFLSSSNYEGISNSMLEAMAVGLPCICTDCPVGGARMYITHGTSGLLVPVGNAEKMAECMGLLAENRELSEEISRNASRIRQSLSADYIVKKWEALF